MLPEHFCSHSSVGLERLPAKEEAAGSSPAGCTIKAKQHSIYPPPREGRAKYRTKKIYRFTVDFLVHLLFCRVC